MIGGWIMLGVGTMISVTDLVVAQLAPRGRGNALSRDDARPTSPLPVLIHLVGAVVIFLIFAAIAFGVIPMKNIQPIKLH